MPSGTTAREEKEPDVGATNGDAVELALGGVPQTMLWTLHNRASEAARPDGLLVDPEAVRIRDAIPYDYEGHFGPADGIHAVRSATFDDLIRPWMRAHPGGTVVELGAGLETQFQRLDDGHVRWWCVDLPEAIAVRERFLRPTDRCGYLGVSVTDSAWMDRIDPSAGVFVSAQGLFMYLEEADVRRTIVAIVDRFPSVELLFDAIPRGFSQRTLQGLRLTPRYVAPPMPWGVDRRQIEPLLRSWSDSIEACRLIPFGRFRGLKGRVLPLIARVPALREAAHFMVHVRTRPG